LDGGRGGGADGIGHVEAGEALISLSEPDGGACLVMNSCGGRGAEGGRDIDSFLFEEGELAEEKFCPRGFARDALARGVVDIRDFFEG
jgi:hypothetical protein